MKTALSNQDDNQLSHLKSKRYKNSSIGHSASFNTSLLTSLHDFLKIMAEQLVADVLEIEGEEESLTPIEMGPMLLMMDAQIKKEVDQLPPTQRALFEDLKNFAEDQEKESGACTPLDTVISTLVKTRDPSIPLVMAATVVKPEEEPEEGAENLPTFQTEECTSDKALITVIFSSTDPAVISYNLKGASTECADDDYESIGEGSYAEEIDSTEIAQIW